MIDEQSFSSWRSSKVAEYEVTTVSGEGRVIVMVLTRTADAEVRRRVKLATLM
jgi:hypothetical protein